MEKLNEIKFKSEQNLFHPLIGLVMVVVLIYLFYRMILQLYYKAPLGDSPMSNSGLVLFYILLLISLIFFIRLKLALIIDNDSVKINFLPFFQKKILLDSINTLEIIDYKAFGSGIRVSMIYGSIIRVKGEKGLQINSNYNKYLIGIKEADVPLLKGIISQINNKKNQSNIFTQNH